MHTVFYNIILRIFSSTEKALKYKILNVFRNVHRLVRLLTAQLRILPSYFIKYTHFAHAQIITSTESQVDEYVVISYLIDINK